MRIAFITGRLEPGRDGVGDYVRTLAAECRRQGHTVALVSLAETQRTSSAGSDFCPILRLTASESESDGGRAARRWLDGFAPDWVSLHFVPYSFHPRGFFGAWIPLLTRVMGGTRRRHIFFHEIWIGFARDAAWRECISGWSQRRAIGRLWRSLAPWAVHTSTGCYRAALASFGRPVGILPMIGSVPLPAHTLAPAVVPGLPPRALVGGTFGTLHPNWEPENFLADFAALAAARQRTAVLVAAGALRSGAASFARWAEAWRGRVECVALGEQSPEELAVTFARFDFAVSTTPWLLIGKSSSAAALREHGLRVVVTREGAPPRFAASAAELEPTDPGFVPYFRDAGQLVTALNRTLPRAGVASVARQFLADLEAADLAGPQT